jgi:hypothetical protein
MKNFTAILLLAGAGLLLRAGDAPPPATPGGAKEPRPSEFTSEQYYDPPLEQKLKLRFTGASVSPLPGGLQEVRQMQIELFGTNGETTAKAKAPHCQVSPFDGVASSSGPLELVSGDGKFSTSGGSFCWRQHDMKLSLSNGVHTVLQLDAKNLAPPKK